MVQLMPSFVFSLGTDEFETSNFLLRDFMNPSLVPEVTIIVVFGWQDQLYSNYHYHQKFFG